jgi:hypothetical protein
MQITPAQILSGDIIVQGKVPSLAVGRQVVATVLSNPQNGLVLVSMFGRRFFVETTLDLHMGQVLNLKVHATAPRVIMKPVEAAPMEKAALKVIDALVEQLSGRFGQTPLTSFDVREIIRRILAESPQDPSFAQAALRLAEDYTQLPPNTLAYLLIPFVQDEDRARAWVRISREGEGYRIHFDVETDALGLIESTVVRVAAGIVVEISSGSEDVVSFLRDHVQELAQVLSPFGVLSLEVVQKKPASMRLPNVDVVV